MDIPNIEQAAANHKPSIPMTELGISYNIKNAVIPNITLATTNPTAKLSFILSATPNSFHERLSCTSFMFTLLYKYICSLYKNRN